jgi:hypothetical protein
MSRIIAAIVLVAVLAVGGGIVATTAYQAGLNTAVTTTVTDGGTVVAPVVPAYAYGYGYGWHPFGFGFGFFGFLFTLFFLFIVFGLIRAIIFGGRGRRGGWGGGPWDPEARRAHFESRFHGTFEDWHRQAHDAPAGSTNPPTASPPTANPPTSNPPA